MAIKIKTVGIGCRHYHNYCLLRTTTKAFRYHRNSSHIMTFKRFCFVNVGRKLIYNDIYLMSRLNNNKSGGAWCPLEQLSTNTSGKEWIEVSLDERYAITGVATQGRYGAGYGVEFVEEYWIEYSRDNGSKWLVWNSTDGNHVCLISSLVAFIQF